MINSNLKQETMTFISKDIVETIQKTKRDTNNGDQDLDQIERWL